MDVSLHPKQAMVYRDPHRFKCVVAGRRWGKTALSRTILVTRVRKPKQKVWYIAPSYRMAKMIMWDELKEAIPKKWVYKIHETELSIRLTNGSIIECKGADQPDTLRGVGLHYVVLDEFQDMHPDTWTKVIRPTLATTGGDALFIGTPKAFNHLHEVYSIGQDSTKRQWASWQFPTITSPFIPEQELEDAREDMDPKSFRQEFEASFETMSGRVYHQFDRQVHTGNFPFNPKLPIWVGQDFNIDPMSSAIMQPQPNGELWVVDEIYFYNSNTQEVVEELERRYWRNTNQIIVYPDPAGNNRQHARGESDLDIFREHGFRKLKYRRKHPKVADRVNCVNKMLRDATGKVRLRINSSCKNMISSLDQTMYKPGSRDVDKAANIEHLADALGYPIELEFPSRKVKIVGTSI
ncbi:Phage terminase large subunit [Vibrio coralliirubri]|uniref:terminase large subunit domain-containing protein n=1 Tax=Vibrio coralliirubri TaxID=1516159 RepID=UPI00063591B9|nr:terminase family protein [Vibrio coralliirubri]CDT52744.1 Phage terminase large subunit [Vibrio coralliirubri]